MALYNKLDMSKEIKENKEIDAMYQNAQAMVSRLGNLQKEQAISYIKKVEQKKISELQQELLSES